MSDFIQIEVKNVYRSRWENSIRVNLPPKYRALMQGLADIHGEKGI
jgi:hypothetical protein